MRKLRILAIVIALTICCSCQKAGSDPSQNTDTGSSDISATTTTESVVRGTSEVLPTDTPTPTPSPSPTPTPAPTDILISFIGDTTLGEQRGHTGLSNCFTNVVGDDFAYPFQYAVEYLANDDMTLCNLEGPLTTSTSLRPDREIYLKGDPKYVECLVQGSIECCNLANNHALDYTQAGLDETRATLDSAGIIWSDSSYFSIYEVKGVKIGMAGFNFTYERQLYYNAIDTLREQGCDIVIISCHIGVERMYEPEQAAIDLAHDVIDYGADIYVGSHPHRLQPVEYYNGKYIIYSESNFCFGGQPYLSDPDTAIFQCTFTVYEGQVTNCRMECIPFSMRTTSSGNDYCPIAYEKGTEEYDRVMEKLRWSDDSE